MKFKSSCAYCYDNSFVYIIVDKRCMFVNEAFESEKIRTCQSEHNGRTNTKPEHLYGKGMVKRTQEVDYKKRRRYINSCYDGSAFRAG